jgi:ketosteroid isomerase-like protein
MRLFLVGCVSVATYALAACSPSVNAPEVTITDANRAIVLEVFAALESGDLATLEKYFAPEGDVLLGLDARKRGGPFATFRDAAPFPGSMSDVAIEIEHVVAENDKVVVQSLICGNQSAAMMGYEPTGKRICSRYINLYVLADGKIISNSVSVYRDQVRNQLEAGLDL